VSKNGEGSKPPLLNWLGLENKIFERQDLISCQRICDTFLNGSQFGSILRYQHRLVMHFIGVPMINGPQCLQALIKELLLVPQWGFTCVGVNPTISTTQYICNFSAVYGLGYKHRLGIHVALQLGLKGPNKMWLVLVDFGRAFVQTHLDYRLPVDSMV